MGFKLKNKLDENGFNIKEREFASASDLAEISLETVTQNFDYTALANLDSGTVSSYTDNTLTDTTKTWVINSFVDSVVKTSTDELEDDYCIITSNTVDTLTFDCNMSALDITSYMILDTYVIEPEDMNSVVSFDITDNCGAIILPSVSDLKNRQTTYIYNELADNVSNKLTVIARENNLMRGNKWLTLDSQWEGIQLYSHYRGVYHWDILNIENVKRYFDGKIISTIDLDSITYDEILLDGSMSVVNAKRFVSKVTDGVIWVKYKSVVSNEFILSGVLQMTKLTTTFSTIEITVRVKQFATGLTVDFTDEASTIRIKRNDSISLPIYVPFSLDANDEITFIATNDDGLVTLETGSSFSIREY